MHTLDVAFGIVCAFKIREYAITIWVAERAVALDFDCLHSRRKGVEAIRGSKMKRTRALIIRMKCLGSFHALEQSFLRRLLIRR